MARRARMRTRRIDAAEGPHLVDLREVVVTTPPAGNQAIRRLVLTGEGRGGAAAPEVEPAEQAQPAVMTAPQPVTAETGPSTEPFSLLVETELEGHGNGPGSGNAGDPGAAGAESPSGGAVDVVVNLTVNEPVEQSRPGEEIASAHDQEGAMGWTTPRYSIQTTGSSATSGTVDVTLDFTIELAEEYDGKTLDVLRDHEYGHVAIGRSAAEVVLAQLLEQNLEALPVLSRATAAPIINTAGQMFEFWEGTFSWIYDRLDYPRMREAYLGARMTLDELIAASPAVGPLADALRAFAAVGDEPADAQSEARALLAARAGLDDLALARVQYNSEFEELVFGADETIARLLNVLEDESPAEATIREVMAMLGDFTWETPGAG